MTWHVRRVVRELSPAPGVADALQRLRGRRGLAACDSTGGHPARSSFVAFDPLRADPPPGSLAALEAWRSQVVDAGGDPPPTDFAGGAVLALSYDLGVAGEERHFAPPRDPWGLPLVAGGLHCDWIAWDHESGRAWLVLGEDATGGSLDGRPPASERERELRALLGAPCEPPAPFALVGELRRLTSAVRHKERIVDVRRRIGRGEFYQANLAHRFEALVRGDPLDAYLRLRRRNPAPYAGCLFYDEGSSAGATRSPRGAILSSSPELLLDYDGVEARTRPIKGTVARGVDAAEDARRKQDLFDSAKDRAELAMIVDLERNDLGRLARTGGVRVEGWPRVESYATVHHLVADVVGRMHAGTSAVDVLGALFPGGSITGAPKVAAMKAIADLEGEGRGWFTGALGWIGHDGRAAFNILIRTMVWRPRAGGLADHDGEVCFHVGGGITFASDPAAEDDETLHKARALIEVLEGR
ncbi:MAG: anthranilate synthase component I family protein [Planctomycetia bacterium]